MGEGEGVAGRQNPVSVPVIVLISCPYHYHGGWVALGIRLFHGHQNCQDLPIKPGPTTSLSLTIGRSLMQSSFDNRTLGRYTCSVIRSIV